MFENLRMLPHAPGVQMQPIPEDAIDVEMDEETEKPNPEERISIRASEKRISNENELSDSEDEGEGRRDVRALKKTKKSKTDTLLNTASDNKQASALSTAENKESEDADNKDDASKDVLMDAAEPVELKAEESSAIEDK